MKKINWGILGTAKIAKQHIIPGIYKSKNSNLYAIASRKIYKASAFSKNIKISKHYGSYAELYADKEVDVIYNPLPNHLCYRSCKELHVNPDDHLIAPKIIPRRGSAQWFPYAQSEYQTIVYSQ